MGSERPGPGHSPEPPTDQSLQALLLLYLSVGPGRCPGGDEAADRMGRHPDLGEQRGRVGPRGLGAVERAHAIGAGGIGRGVVGFAGREVKIGHCNSPVDGVGTQPGEGPSSAPGVLPSSCFSLTPRTEAEPDPTPADCRWDLRRFARARMTLRPPPM